MTSSARRGLLRGLLGIGLITVIGGCGPSTGEMALPSERHKEAEATKTPPPKGMRKQEDFDPRTSPKAKSIREAAAKS
jgi:hypothetical protein